MSSVESSWGYAVPKNRTSRSGSNEDHGRPPRSGSPTSPSTLTNSAKHLFQSDTYHRARNLVGVTLHDFSREGMVDKATTRLQSHPEELNATSSEGTPLVIACIYNQPEIIRLLVEKGVDLNSSNLGANPLILACNKGSVDAAAALIQLGAKTDMVRPDGTDLMMIAAQTNMARLVLLLVERGIPVDRSRALDGATPFSIAWEYQSIDFMKALVNAPQPINFHSIPRNTETVVYVLQAAVTKPRDADWALVRLLLARLDAKSFAKTLPGSAWFDNVFQQLLSIGAARGDLDLVQILAEQHRQVDFNGVVGIETPLVAAVRSGSPEVVSYVLKQKAHPYKASAVDADAVLPMQVAASRNDYNIAKLLLPVPHDFRTVSMLLRSAAKSPRVLHIILAGGGSSLIDPAEDEPRKNAELRFNRELSHASLTDPELSTLFKSETTALQSLNLSDNLLVSPQISYRFSSLTSLNLSRNKLKFPPGDLSALPVLQTLDLSSNLIADMQLLIEDHPSSLLTLSLVDNPLDLIPIRLYTLTSLQRFDFSPSLRLGLPDSVQLLPTPELFGYLSALGEKTAYWNQAKLVFVGPEGVGKSSLSKFLVSDQVDDGSPNIATNGIDIQDWFCYPSSKPWRYYCTSCFTYFTPAEVGSVPQKDRPSLTRSLSRIGMFADSGTGPSRTATFSKCKKCNGSLVGDPLTISLWDFGGQEVFHPTHQLFMSDRTIYVLVFSCTNVQDRVIEYWLRQINSHGRSRPPILLVGTHRDQRNDPAVNTLATELETKFKQPWCGNVRGVILVSCTSKRTGLDSVRQQILESAQRLVSTTAVPAYYVLLKKLVLDLKSEGQGIVRYEVLERSCAEQLSIHIEAMPDLRGALAFFHDAGLLLYFNVPELRDVIILDPRWLAQVMATIITFRPNFVTKTTGLLALSDLKHVWKAYPPELHQRLLSLLLRFGVAYQLPSHLLFPSLVNGDLTELMLAPLQAQVLRLALGRVRTFGRLYRFEFLPLGFFARVAVGVFTALKLSSDYQLWSNAILLLRLPTARREDRSEGTALLVYDLQKLELLILVNASHLTAAGPPDALKTLIEVVESTLSGFYSTYADRLQRYLLCSHCLPSPACAVKIASGVTTFSLQSFSIALQAGKKLICTQSGVTHPVALEELAPDLALTDLPVLTDDQISIVRLLGKGASGQVWLAARFDTRSTVALKSLHQGTEREENLLFLTFQREIAMMSKLRHPNLVQLQAILLRPLRMVMEYAPLGDLFHLLRNNTTLPAAKLTWRLRVRIAEDIALGMLYLHSHTPPIVHRDLRSPNIFIMSFEESAAVVAKVADFGLAQRMTITTGFTDKLETWQWCAPEAFASSRSYTERADVYSFGIILWELVSRQFPFDEFIQGATKMSVFKIKEQICDEHEPLRPTFQRLSCPSRHEKLAKECWQLDPGQRPDFFEIVPQLRLIDSALDDRQVPQALTDPRLKLKKQLSVPLAASGVHATALLTIAAEEDIAPTVWVGCSDGNILIYDPFGWLKKVANGYHSAKLCNMSFLQCSKRVFTASEDYSIHLWSAADLSLLVSIQGNLVGGPIRSVTAVHPPASAEAEEIWTGDSVGTIKAWMLDALGRSGLRKSAKLISAADTDITSICQVSDGGVVAGCSGGTLRKLHPQSLREIRSYSRAHRGKISALMSVDELLVSASDDCGIAVWNYKFDMLHRLSIHHGKVTSLASLRKNMMISGGADFRICIFDATPRLAAGKVCWADKASLNMPNICTEVITAVSACRISDASAPLCATVWTSSKDGQLKVWTLDTEASDAVVVATKVESSVNVEQPLYSTAPAVDTLLAPKTS